MSNRTYPRFDSYKKLSPATTSTCKAIGCGKQATRKIFIQVDYMRGNDECTLVCDEHFVGANKATPEFFAQFSPEVWK